jgi:hypothetical protein
MSCEEFPYRHGKPPPGPRGEYSGVNYERLCTVEIDIESVDRLCGLDDHGCHSHPAALVLVAAEAESLIDSARLVEAL